MKVAHLGGLPSLAAAVLGLATALSASAPGDQAQSPATPIFRAGVDYVSVDVVVTDSRNHPIPDLTAEDFRITEHGQPQRISDFRYISIPVAHRSIDLKAKAAPPADVVTNALPSPDSRLFVMVVDDLHLLEAQIVPVKRVMTEFVSSLSPDDEVGIVFVGHSDLSANVTRDQGRLVQAINNARDAFGFGLATPSAAPGALAPASEYLQAARSVAWELRNVSSALARSGHARRAIVFVSGGTPLDPSSPLQTKEATAVRAYQLDLNDAFEAARRADVPIYTIDPRGIPSPDTATRGWGPTSAIQRENLQHRIAVQQDHMAEIATNTGGRFFTNRSDLMGAIDEIVGENGSFYLLGYSPDPYQHDGKFHDIDVKVTRPGVSVRGRKGYLAASTDAASATTTSTIDSAMGVGSSVAGLTLRAWATPIAPAEQGMTAAVTIEVDYPATPDLSTRVDDTLETSILALGPDAEVRASSRKPWHIAGTTSKDGPTRFTIDQVIAVPSKPTTLRVGVASQALHQAGTIQMPLEMPNPGDGKLQIAGVAIGLATPPGGALGGDAFAGVLPFQPVTAREFTARDTLRVFASALWKGKDSAATGTLALLGPSSPTPQPIAMSVHDSSPAHRLGTFDVSVPLTELKPGPYVLDVTITITGQTAHREVPFSIR